MHTWSKIITEYDDNEVVDDLEETFTLRSDDNKGGKPKITFILSQILLTRKQLLLSTMVLHKMLPPPTKQMQQTNLLLLQK